MKACLSLADVDSIKAELVRLLPNVKSSHRVEAMARGLGWNTNAALRAALGSGPVEREVDDHAFGDYLTAHGFPDTPFATLAEAVVRVKFADVRAAVDAVMEREPLLSYFGFRHYERGKSRQEQDAEFSKNRSSMLQPHALDEFRRACAFLETKAKRATINRNAYSYSLKHQAEAFSGDRGEADTYVANGMLIAAAVHLGFNIRPAGPNAYLNVAEMRRRAAAASEEASAMPRNGSDQAVIEVIADVIERMRGLGVSYRAIGEALWRQGLGATRARRAWTGDEIRVMLGRARMTLA